MLDIADKLEPPVYHRRRQKIREHTVMGPVGLISYHRGKIRVESLLLAANDLRSFNPYLSEHSIASNFSMHGFPGAECNTEEAPHW